MQEVSLYFDPNIQHSEQNNHNADQSDVITDVGDISTLVPNSFMMIGIKLKKKSSISSLLHFIVSIITR